jgi:hypothetical protein
MASLLSESLFASAAAVSGISSNFVILDPLNTGNNTTKNSYLTRDIIKSFQNAFNNLKNLMSKQQTTPTTASPVIPNSSTEGAGLL